MATLVASLRTPSPTAVTITPPTPAQIVAAQILIQNLPSPPKEDPTLNPNPSQVTGTQHALISTQTQVATNSLGPACGSPTPPPTPGTTGSPGTTLLQPANFGNAKGSLTPQTTGTTNSRSVASPGTSSSGQAVTNCGPRSTLSRELKGAVLDLCMDINKQIEEKWEANVRKLVNALVSGAVRNSLRHEQEIMYAAKVRPWPFGTGEKRPSIVVSVADSNDRKTVKKLLKQHQWLQDEISKCGLRLMVVEDPAKLQSKGRLAEPTSATSLYKATLSTGSAAWSYCGATLTSHPESKTSPAALALGGILIIDDAIYGLTAGHAFFDFGVAKLDTSSNETDRSSSESDNDLDEWLDDPSNPFVFKEDDESFQDASTVNNALTSISGDIVPEKVSQILPDPPKAKQLKSTRLYDVTVLTPSINPSQRGENTLHHRNCDWALVELPPDVPIPPNRYFKSTEEVPITRAVSDAARPSGLVQVVLPDNQILEGHLRANAASYRVGSCLFDVRLIYLDEMLRKSSSSLIWELLLTDPATACSGAWVVQDNAVCGYIIAARSDARSVYMLPIHSVLQDIRDTLGVKEVFIPVQDEITQQSHISLRPGRLSDIMVEERSDLIGQGEQFEKPASQRERDEDRQSTVQPNHSPPEARATLFAEGIEGLPQVPKLVHHRRPQLPKKDSTFSVTSRELRPQPRQISQPSSSTNEQRPASGALTRSSDKGTIGGQNMQCDFRYQILKALDVAAFLACWPCLYPLRRKRKHQQADVEHTGLPNTAEKPHIVTEPINSPAPMFYEMPTGMEGHNQVWAPEPDSHYPTSEIWRPMEVSVPETHIQAIQDIEDNTPHWMDQTPTPTFEVEDPLSPPLMRSGEWNDIDDDNISIILLPEDEGAETYIQSPAFVGLGAYPKFSIHGTGDHFDFRGTLQHGDSSRNETDHVFSRSETDLRESSVPGILPPNAFQNWAHSPPFTPTVAYAHTAISA